MAQGEDRQGDSASVDPRAEFAKAQEAEFRKRRQETKFMVLDYIQYVLAKRLGWLKHGNRYFCRHFKEQFAEDILLLAKQVLETHRTRIEEFYNDNCHDFEDQFNRLAFRFFNKMKPVELTKHPGKWQATGRIVNNKVIYTEEAEEEKDGIVAEQHEWQSQGECGLVTWFIQTRVPSDTDLSMMEPSRVNYLSLGYMFAIAGEFAVVCFRVRRKDLVGAIICSLYRLMSNFQRTFYSRGGFASFATELRNFATRYHSSLGVAAIAEALKDSLDEGPPEPFGSQELLRIKESLFQEEETRRRAATRAEALLKTNRLLCFFQSNWTRRYRAHRPLRLSRTPTATRRRFSESGQPDPEEEPEDKRKREN